MIPSKRVCLFHESFAYWICWEVRCKQSLITRACLHKYDCNSLAWLLTLPLFQTWMSLHLRNLDPNHLQKPLNLEHGAFADLSTYFYFPDTEAVECRKTKIKLWKGMVLDSGAHFLFWKKKQSWWFHIFLKLLLLKRCISEQVWSTYSYSESLVFFLMSFNL